LQTIVPRNIGASTAVVLSVTQIHAGAAYNVIPESAELGGTIRYFDDAAAEKACRRLREICDGFALAHGATIEVEIRNVFDVLVNDTKLSYRMIGAARELVGFENAGSRTRQIMGSEATCRCIAPPSCSTTGSCRSTPP
jgi:hippurate hydrolase